MNLESIKTKAMCLLLTLCIICGTSSGVVFAALEEHRLAEIAYQEGLEKEYPIGPNNVYVIPAGPEHHELILASSRSAGLEERTEEVIEEIDEVVEEKKVEQVQQDVAVEAKKVEVKATETTQVKQVSMSQSEVRALIKQVANEIGLDWKVLDALVFTESTYDPNSRNGRHYGLCQVSSTNYNNLKSTLGLSDNYYDPYSNLKCGAYIYQCLLIKYQDYHKALVCYNMGEGGAKGISESAYSRKIMNYARTLQ